MRQPETWTTYEPLRPLEDMMTFAKAFGSHVDAACEDWTKRVMAHLLPRESTDRRLSRTLRRLKRRAKRFPLREPFWEGMP